MATQRWVGNAIAIAQVNTLTVAGTAALNQVYSVTINGKTLSYTATGVDTNTTIATALQAILSMSTAPPEFLEITWTNPSAGVIVGTATNAGIPFTNTSAATGSGTLVTVITTANSGPSDINIAANWSTGSLPITGDDIWFDLAGVPDALYNLGALNAITPNSFHATSAFTSNIGLLDYTGAYLEYRQRYLQFTGVTTFAMIGEGQGPGSGRIKLDPGTGLTSLIVLNTSVPNEANGQSVRFKGTNASNTVEITKGNLGIAAVPGESVTLASLQVGYQTNLLGDSTVVIGPGATLNVINQSGGSLTISTSMSTLTMTGGVFTAVGNSINIATAVIDAGTFNYSCTGSLTALNVGNAGIAVFTGDMRAKTVSTVNMYKGGTYTDSFSTTVGASFHYIRCRQNECNVDTGENRSMVIA